MKWHEWRLQSLGRNSETSVRNSKRLLVIKDRLFIYNEMWLLSLSPALSFTTQVSNKSFFSVSEFRVVNDHGVVERRNSSDKFRTLPELEAYLNAEGCDG